jgi:hypothetical protein
MLLATNRSREEERLHFSWSASSKPLERETMGLEVQTLQEPHWFRTTFHPKTPLDSTVPKPFQSFQSGLKIKKRLFRPSPIRA